MGTSWTTTRYSFRLGSFVFSICQTCTLCLRISLILLIDLWCGLLWLSPSLYIKWPHHILVLPLYILLLYSLHLILTRIHCLSSITILAVLPEIKRIWLKMALLTARHLLFLLLIHFNHDIEMVLVLFAGTLNWGWYTGYNLRSLIWWFLNL